MRSVTETGRYPHLLSPGRIGSLTLRNRTCLTPMGTNLESEDGRPGERITRFYEERAKGGAIAVQLQHAGKTALQDVIAGRPLWVPSELPEKPGDLFAALAPEEIAAVSEPFTRPGSRFALHVVTDADVTTLCGWFADAAERARAAGFDGVEIHAGHGYLISSFLSRSTNLRDDEFGGPLENRARVLVRVIRAVRER